MCLSEKFLLDDLIEQFPALTNLGDEIDGLLSLVYFEEFNDVGMI